MKEIIVKSNIKKITFNKIKDTKQNIIFRIINFNNEYFYAEEISTGCIFPIYEVYNKTLKYFSNIKKSTHFINLPIVINEGHYSLPEKIDCKEGINIPSIDEINEYLQEKRKNTHWKNTLSKLEQTNSYKEDIKAIKLKIMSLKETGQVIQKNQKQKTKKYIPKINTKEIKDYGYDLSTEGNLHSIVGRKEELRKIIKSTAIKASSVLLIGDAGSGKTSIVKHLALEIRNNKNEWLRNKMIFSINTTKLVKGTKYRGEFEDKIDTLVEFCKKNKGLIILFIDDIHTLYSLGNSEESKYDAIEMLKPHISNGDIVILGTTTPYEYETYMKKDTAFLSNFENIEIPIPDKKMNIDILLSYIKELEEIYQIKFELTGNKRTKVVEYIIEKTDANIQNLIGDFKRKNPALSKTIIENAFSESLYRKDKIVTIKDIAIALTEYKKMSLTLVSDFGYDLSLKDNLCKLIGREEEQKQIIKSVGIMGESVLLVGEPGTGKTSLVEKIALDIKQNKCPALKGKTIFCLNTANLIAGKSIKGDFEKAMNQLIGFCQKNKDKIILFIDEIHTLYGLGRDGSGPMDALNILKPHISNGDITIIGATTNDEYNEYLAKDPAFVRRLKKMEVAIPDKDLNLKILLSYINDLKEQYKVNLDLTDEKLKEIVEYIIDITDVKNQIIVGDTIKITNPTISKSIIQDAFAEAIYNGRNLVSVEDFAFAILSSNKLSPTFRKEKAEKIKNKLPAPNNKNTTKVLKLTGN